MADEIISKRLLIEIEVASILVAAGELVEFGVLLAELVSLVARN